MQKRDFDVNFKILDYELRIIFVHMIRIPTFTLWAFVIFAGGFCIASAGWNMSITWYIHQHGFHEADLFFSFYTQLAEWGIIVVAGGLAWAVSRRLCLFYGITAAVQGIVIWSLKQWFNAPRPATISAEQIRSIPGVDLQYWQSFPSGHTAIGLLCFGFMTVAITQLLRKNNKIIELCFLYLALAMGYSRMYLGQHNLLDVSVGGLVALTFLHTSLWLFNNWGSKVAKAQ